MAVGVLAAALRWPDMGAGAGSGDEATVVERAVRALGGELMPPAFDWPPGSSYLLAAAVLAGRVLGFDAAADPDRLYTFARLLFAAIAVATVVLTGVLGAALGDERRAGWTGVGAALALAVSFVSVRLSRAAHPEHLQMLLVLLTLLAALRFDHARHHGWLAVSGLTAGLAGAVKYLGITVAIVPLAAAVLARDVSWPKRLGAAALLAAATVVGFVGGTLGTAVRGTAFANGFVDQWRHQAGGHLGYEAAEPGWVFHLGTSLPGTWGWPLTLAALAGIAIVALRGSRPQRLVAAYAVLLLGLVGASRIAFPHYVLVVTPLLAVFALIALGRLTRPALVIVLVAVSLVPTFLHDLRLLRLDDAPTTFEHAGAIAADLPGPVWSDHSTGVTAPQRSEFSLAEHADEVLRCGCYVALSSLQEARYRRLPERYAEQVAGYDAIREAGTVVAVIEPSLPLSYRWDLLPQWGLGRVPLRGPLPTVGPTVTILDLTAAS